VREFLRARTQKRLQRASEAAGDKKRETQRRIIRNSSMACYIKIEIK